MASLASQTLADWEAIVVLDGDIDDSESVVMATGDARVRTITFAENRGRVAALNAGFDAARGNILVRCDDDLRPKADYVARHVELHSGVTPVGAIGLYRNVYPSTPYAEAYGTETDVRFRRDAYAVPADLRWRYWAGNVSVTRATYDLVGPYDPAYRAYGWEDVDWGYRLHRAGVEVVLDPALETEHFVAATTTESRALRAFHSGAARHTFEAKHGASTFTSVRRSRTGWWNRAVFGTASHLTRSRTEQVSRLIDRALPRLPRPLGKKLVALAVEASSEAGYAQPGQVTNDL